MTNDSKDNLFILTQFLIKSEKDNSNLHLPQVG